MKLLFIYLILIAIIGVALFSCAKPVMVQKHVYKSGKLVPVGEAERFHVKENDTIILITRK